MSSFVKAILQRTRGSVHICRQQVSKHWGVIRYLRREAVDHVGVPDQNQVQPTTAPPPARRHAKLSPSGLQQIPSLLKTQQVDTFISAI